jgi:hypothetical protein
VPHGIIRSEREREREENEMVFETYQRCPSDGVVFYSFSLYLHHTLFRYCSVLMDGAGTQQSLNEALRVTWHMRSEIL